MTNHKMCGLHIVFIYTLLTNTVSSKELFKVLEDFKEQVLGELKSTRNEINGLTEAMQFVSNKMDESTNLMKEIKSELAKVKKENENLRNLNKALTTEVDLSSLNLDSLKKWI